LRVHPDQITPWQEFFAQQPNLQPVPELMGDATLDAGHCLLETELGSSDLTLETQLKEIEQGFFDLLAQKPKEQ
jgi:flagellar assembly protein FliH